MRLTRSLFVLATSVVFLSGCGSETVDRSADAACNISVIKSLELLPAGVNVDVQTIESGKSGDAVSCKVTGSQTNIMIDATVTCTGGAPELMACTTINGITTLEDKILYPPAATE